MHTLALSERAQAAKRDIVQQDMRPCHARARVGSAAPDFFNSQQAKQGRKIFLSCHGLPL